VTAARWRAVAAAYAVLLLIAALIPEPPAAPRIPHLDKAVHLCEYLLFAWLLRRTLAGSPAGRSALRAFAAATLYGLALELLQRLVPWRSADMADAVFNALGAALGVAVNHPDKTQNSRGTL